MKVAEDKEKPLYLHLVEDVSSLCGRSVKKPLFRSSVWNTWKPKVLAVDYCEDCEKIRMVC